MIRRWCCDQTTSWVDEPETEWQELFAASKSMLSAVAMEVVPLMTSSDAASPFGRRDVAEWSRLDMRTGVTENARVETDRWAQATPTSKHSYGKVVDSRDRSLPDGSARQRQRQQLEVFQTAGPGGSLQVIRTQSVTSTNSTWRSSTSAVTSSARAALPSVVRDFGDDLQMTLNPLDLSREKSKGSVGRSGSIGGRRPPSRPRAMPPPPPTALAIPELSVQEAVDKITASRELPLGALHSLLSRQRSSSTEDLAAVVTSGEPDALRRSSRVRRSLQFSARSLEARGGVARLLLDLEERGVSQTSSSQSSDAGRSVNNVSLDSFSRKFANAKQRHSYSEPEADDAADDRKQVAAKRHSFVTVESLNEVRGRLKRMSSSEDGAEAERAAEESFKPLLAAVETEVDETATSLVKSYVFGMEAMSRGGTGSLESRTGNRAVRSDEWYNRRKSYGFERVGADAANDSSSSLAATAALQSTDSGIHHSSEMFSTPSWSRNRGDDAKRGSTVVNLGGDLGGRGAMLSALLVNGVRGDDRRATTVSTIPVTLSDDSPTVESRRLFYQQLAQGTTLSVEKSLKKSLDSVKAVAADDWWMRPKFSEITLPSMAAKRHSIAGSGWRAKGVEEDEVKRHSIAGSGWRANGVEEDEVKRHSIAGSGWRANGVEEDEVKRHSIAVDEFQGTGELDRKNGVAKKRVEFCKTEVHFAAEPGRFNIVETDEKPPSTNMFRRRRRSTNASAVGVAAGSGLPEVRFGDHERVLAGKEAVTTAPSTSSQHGQRSRPTTLRLSLEEDVHDKEHQVYTESNATIRPEAEHRNHDDHHEEQHSSGHLELTESSSDTRPRGILKPRVGPPAYLLGQSDGEDRRQGVETDQSEERWGVRLRPAVQSAVRDAVMPAEYSGQSELQKLLRSLRPAAPRNRTDSDAAQRADWYATERGNGNKEPDWTAAEARDVEKVPDWTMAKGDHSADWSGKPMKATDWSSKTEKSSEWLNETEKLADWSPKTERIADWSVKADGASDWQSKSMERQNKFSERLNAKAEKLTETRTERLSNWSPKTGNPSDRLTKSLERQNNFAERLVTKSEDRKTEPRTEKLSDWPAKAEKLSDWSPKVEKLSDWSPKAEKLSDWSAKPEKLSDWSPKTEKLSDWSAKPEKLSDWSPKTEKLSDWSAKPEKLSDWSPKTEKLSDWSAKPEKLSDWSPKTEKLSDWSAKPEKLSDWSPKTEKLSDWSPKTEKLSDWSPKTEKLSDWSPKTEKLSDWSVADRVRSVEQSKGFSTRVNFGPGEATVVAPATPTEARRFSSGDRPKPVWQRREEALAAAGYSAVEMEDKRTMHTATTTATVPSYESRGLRSVETLVNVRSGQPKITSISLRYHGDQPDAQPRTNGHHETSKAAKFTSRTSISPERPPLEPTSKPSASLFAADDAKAEVVVETARLVASFERKANAKATNEQAAFFAPRPEVRDDTKQESVTESEFQRSAPGRARLRTTETTFSSTSKSSRSRVADTETVKKAVNTEALQKAVNTEIVKKAVNTEIGTVKKAVSASPLAARRVTATSSSVNSSTRELIGRRQTANTTDSASSPRRPASLKDITEAPVANGLSNGVSNGDADVLRHTFTSSSYQQRAECRESRQRSASRSPANGRRSPSSERDAPRSASLSPVYQNRALYRENSGLGLEAEPDSVILAELTRAAEEILRAVHGYTDDETPPSTRPISEHPDDRRANHRRPLGTIAETHVLRRTEVKEARTQRETTRLASKLKTKLGPTSSNSSVEGVESRRPIRADAAEKRPTRGETTDKRPIRTETAEKRPIRTERVSRTARMVQRASSRELLLQTHASSSEDVASGSEGPKQRAPPRRRSTATKSAVKTPGGRSDKPAPEPARSTRTSSSRTKPRDSTTATTTTTTTTTEAAKKTPETKQYPLKEKTIPGIVSQRDRSSRAGAASAVRAKKSPSSRPAAVVAKAGK